MGNLNINFTAEVLSLVDSGLNITHILAFNEPDGPFYQGGSNFPAADAVAR
jgi:hypothetical protein